MPLEVDLPLSTHELLIDSHEGPPLIDQVYGADPPETDKAWLQLVFFVSLGSDVVPMAGLVTTVSVILLPHSYQSTVGNDSKDG